MTLAVTSPAPTVTDVSSSSAAPPQTDMAVVGMVIGLVLLTLLVCVFLLYRYQCHSKGEYRTTGEPAAGIDSDQIHTQPLSDNKREYFI